MLLIENLNIDHKRISYEIDGWTRIKVCRLLFSNEYMKKSIDWNRLF